MCCLPGNHVRPWPARSVSPGGVVLRPIPIPGLTTCVLTCEQVRGPGAVGGEGVHRVAGSVGRPRARAPGPGKPTSGSYSFRRTMRVETMGGSLR